MDQQVRRGVQPRCGAHHGAATFRQGKIGTHDLNALSLRRAYLREEGIELFRRTRDREHVGAFGQQLAQQRLADAAAGARKNCAGAAVDAHASASSFAS